MNCINLLYSVDYIGNVESGTYVETNIDAVDAPYVFKNGIQLDKGVDYTFTRPRTLALTLAADSEEYIAHLYTGAEDAVITELIVQADQIIDDRMYMYDQNGPSAAQKKTWSIWLASGLYLSSYGLGVEEDLAKSDYYMKLAADSMDAFVKNSAGGTQTTNNTHRPIVHQVNMR